MRTKKPHYSKDEFAKRGDRIYERDIHLHLTPEDEGKFVLIDIETGAYEIDADELAASDRLLARRPAAQVWMARVGLRAARIRRRPKQPENTASTRDGKRQSQRPTRVF